MKARRFYVASRRGVVQHVAPSRTEGTYTLCGVLVTLGSWHWWRDRRGARKPMCTHCQRKLQRK